MFKLIRTLFLIAATITTCHAKFILQDVLKTAVARGVTKMSVADMMTTFSAPAYQRNMALFEIRSNELNNKHAAVHESNDSKFKCDKTCSTCVSCIRAGRQLALDDLYLMAGALAACCLPLVDEAICAPILAAAIGEAAKKQGDFCIQQDQPLTCPTDCSFATCAAVAKTPAAAKKTTTTKKTTRGMLALEFSS